MPLKIMRSSLFSGVSSFKLNIVRAAVVSAVVISTAHAASLGKLTVLSSLGQPLRAEIELTSVAQDEVGSLVPKLASVEAFKQANIDFNPALFSLRFAVEQRGSQQIVRVTSTQPINEPYVDMLLELGGNKGRLVREYTFLLDPPEMRAAQAAQIAPIISSQPLPPVRPAAQATTINRAPSETEPVRNIAPARSAAKAERTASTPKADAGQADEYRVKKGDSLAKIANQYRPDGVSLDQMLVALYRANPAAFVGKNMNRLRAGQILSVPDADMASSVKQSQARGVVIAQAADFNSYRGKLAGQVANGEAKKSEDTSQTSSGKITTRIQENTAAPESKDKLKLSKAGATAGGADKAGASTEDAIAKDKAIADANARVKALEKNVADLQNLLDIKNRDLADKQKQAALPPVALPSSAPVALPEIQGAAASGVAAAVPALASATVAAPASAVAAAPVVIKKKKPAVVTPLPAPQSSFLEDLMSNALFLPGAAILLALLAILGIYSARRRQKPKAFEESIITDSTLKSNSLFGSTGGQSVDTNNSVFNSNFVPSASQLDTNEVDPIAEADVYIAYGRDAQAEEILKEALRTQPDRHAVRVKLLEIYANRKDLRSFEILASELYSMTKGEGEDWKQAAALGLTLDPSNPLYTAAQEGTGAKVATPVAPVDDVEATNTSFDDAPIDASPLEQLSAPNTSLAVAPPQPAAEVEDLDFDLGDLHVDSPAEVPKTAEPAEIPEEIAAIDFDFLDDKSSASDAPASHAEAGLPTLEVQPVPEDASHAALDFPASAPAPAANAVESPTPAEFDLSDIALDLHPAGTPAVADEAQAASGLEDLLEPENYTVNAEMATKLDLAIAYQEIGDKEGARELLEEVIKGGNGEQSERAKNLLSKLS